MKVSEERIFPSINGTSSPPKTATRPVERPKEKVPVEVDIEKSLELGKIVEEGEKK